MKIKYSFKQIALLTVLSIMISSCSDDIVSSNEDPPELPMLLSVEPDISYFQNNPPQNSNSNYFEAYYYGLGLGSFGFITQSYLAFFSQANSSEADFQDGKWTWEYGYSFEGQSISIELISQEVGDFVEWEMLWTVNDGQGTSFTNYKVVEGRLSKNGTSGTWTFNSLNPNSGEEEAALITEWTSTGDNNLDTNIDLYEDGELTSSYNYLENNNEFLVSLNEIENQNEIIVFWDDSALTGYYQIGSDSSNRLCWDSNYADVTCSTIGY